MRRMLTRPSGLVCVVWLLLGSLVPHLARGQALDQGYIDYVNPLLHGAECTTATLQAAIAAIGSAEKTLYLTATNRAKVDCTWQITQTLTLPPNITLWVPFGVKATIATGASLTVQGCVQSGNEPWFTGSVTGASCGPSWGGDGMASYIKSGCLHPLPGSGATIVIPACTAMMSVVAPPGLAHLQELHAPGVSFTLAQGDGSYFAIVKLTTTAVSGWECQGNFCVRKSTDFRPPLPDGSLLISRTDLVSGVVARVQDMRVMTPIPFRWVNVATYMTPEEIRDPTLDKGPAITRACAALTLFLQAHEGQLTFQNVLFFPSGTYRVTSSIACDLGFNTQVMAYGVYLEAALTSGDVFNLNPKAVANNIGATSNGFVRWYGGVYVCTAAPPTASITTRMFVAYAFRNLSFADVRVESCGVGIEMSGQDTYSITRSHFFDNVQHVLFSNWAQDEAAGLVIEVTLSDNHFSINQETGRSDACGVCVKGQIINLTVADSSFNHGLEGPTLAGIYINNEFNNNRFLHIERNHFEGKAAQKYIWFHDNGGIFEEVSISKSSFAWGAATAITLEGVQYASIDNNAFKQTSEAGGHSIVVTDVGNNHIDIGCTNRFDTAKPEYHAGALITGVSQSRRESFDVFTPVSTNTITLTDVCTGFIAVQATGGAPAGGVALRTINGGWIGRMLVASLQPNVLLEPGGNINMFNLGTIPVAQSQRTVWLSYGSNLQWNLLSESMTAQYLHTVTVADNGTGDPATGTIDTGASDVYVECLDPNGCTMTMAKAFAYFGQRMLITCSSTVGSCTFSDQAGILRLPGTSVALANGDTLSLWFQFSANNQRYYLATGWGDN